MRAETGAMHYPGAEAMRASAIKPYNPWTVTLCVIAAAGLS